MPPPFGILDLGVRFGKRHIGSRSLRTAVEKWQPRVVICGHVHFWGGRTGRIGPTLVVNVSSHDNPGAVGNYALIDTADWSVVKMRAQKRVPYVRGLSGIRKKINQIAVSRENCDALLAAHKAVRYPILPGNPSPSTIASRIRRVEQLGIRAERVAERVESLEWKEPKIVGQLTFDPDMCTFLDVETGLLRGDKPGRLWLVGVWHMGSILQFVLPREKKQLIRFLEDVGPFVSWTNYDQRAMSNLLKENGIEVTFFDARTRSANCVVWHTYGLHELYKALFPGKSEGDLIPGDVAGLYADHIIIPGRKCRHCPSKESLVERIKARNRADLLQMREICRKLS